MADSRQRALAGERGGDAAEPRPGEEGGRRRQARGLATRARLLDAAEDLFARQGFDGASIGDVAERAGVGVGTVYHHFPDKRAILLQLIEGWGDRIEAQASSEEELERFLGGDPREALGRWLRRSYERLRANPSLYVVVLSVAGRDEEVAERYRRIERLSASRFRELVEFGQRRGLMRRSIDAASAAFLVNNAIDVAATQVFVRGVRDPDPDRVVGELHDMICRYILVDGLGDA
jgi:AcrR family transcriptional regulator